MLRMSKTRMELFSDAVIAIIITIMVLELRPPKEAGTWEGLLPLLPVFLSYLMSLVFMGIYCINHHHLLQVAQHVGNGVLWANMHFLFWLSLIPFATAWMGEHHEESGPVALYGVILLCSGIAYYILAQALLSRHGKESKLAAAL